MRLSSALTVSAVAIGAFMLGAGTPAQSDPRLHISDASSLLVLTKSQGCLMIGGIKVCKTKKKHHDDDTDAATPKNDTGTDMPAHDTGTDTPKQDTTDKAPDAKPKKQSCIVNTPNGGGGFTKIPGFHSECENLGNGDTLCCQVAD